MSATDKIMDQVSGLVSLGTHGRPMALAWAELRGTIARTIGDLERARDAALEERNRLGVELAGARTRIAELQTAAEQWRVTVESLQSGHRSQHDADSRELRSLCVARDAARKGRDAALAEASDLRALLAEALAGRDDLQAEVERLRAELDRYRRDEA